jgi:hypothetical protein
MLCDECCIPENGSCELVQFIDSNGEPGRVSAGSLGSNQNSQRSHTGARRQEGLDSTCGSTGKSSLAPHSFQDPS